MAQLRPRVGIVATKLPLSMAWHRDTKIMSPVINQGHTNICWALGTVSVIEAYTHLIYGERCKLSTQELLDCCERITKDDEDKQEDENRGYTNPTSAAFKWIEKNGIQLESEYRQRGDGEPLIGRCEPKKKEWNGVRVASHKVVCANESKLLEALVDGPVVGGILFTNDIGSIKDGIWDGTMCLPFGSKYNYHTVVFTGYGTNEKGVNFYWYQSSWGENWGVKGYGKLRRESSYNWKTTPPTDLIKWTKVPGKPHRISKGIETKTPPNEVDKGVKIIDDPEEKSYLISTYLMKAFEDFNYNEELHLTLLDVETVHCQSKELWKRYGFKVKVKDSNGRIKKYKLRVLSTTVNIVDMFKSLKMST